MSQIFELRYLVIPAHAYKDERLTLVSLKVYGFIHAYTNPFYFSNAHLAEMFKCSERSITEAMSSLEKLKYIKMTHTPKAGGGTTRLAVDCLSDSQSSSSRIYSIKDNSLKDVEKPITINTVEEAEKTLGNDEDLYDRKRARRQNRVPFKSNFGGFNSPAKSKGFQKKERTAAHGEGII